MRGLSGAPQPARSPTLPDENREAEKPAALPAALLVAVALTALVVMASALVGPATAPEFFITYALVQAAMFLVLIYMADLYERAPVTVVGLMVLWGGTVACLFALPGNQFVNSLLPAKIRVVFGPAIAAPLVEEAAKGAALVLAFWLSQVAARRLGAHAFEGLTDGLVYGAAVGLGFAFTEDIFYFYGLANQAGLQEGWDVFRSRADFFGLNMFGHSIYTGLTGAGLGAATVIVRPHRRFLAVVGGFGLAVVAHAAHNGLVSTVLAVRFGLDTAAAALGNTALPPGLLDDVDATASAAQTATELVDFLLLVAFFAAVVLWLRHQQLVIATGLTDEDPEVAFPEETHLVVHYPARVFAYGRLLLEGKVDEWRLARVVHAELTALAFVKWRVRGGRADPAQIERQRYLAAWAQAALAANRSRSDRGSRELLLLSDEALRSSRYDLVESLLEVRSALVVPDDVTRGRMAVTAGRHLAESGFRYEEASEQYGRAVAAFDRTLARDPADAGAHTHRAGALFRLGEVQAESGRTHEAVANYREAVASADAALCLDPGLAESHRNRAAALMRLGEAEAQRARYQDARSAYREAVAAVDATLALTPDDARAQNIAGIALIGLGEAETALDLPEEAMESFGRAITACGEAGRLVPDFAYAHFNLGKAWSRLAETQAGGEGLRDGEASYRCSLGAFDEALRVAPGYVKALAGRGGARARLGGIQANQGRVEEAVATAATARGDCEQALALAFGHAPAHVARAEALLLHGRLVSEQGDFRAGADAFEQAILACDDALRLSPGAAAVRTLRAAALLALARSLAAADQRERARARCVEARQEADRALALAGAGGDARLIRQESVVFESKL